MEAVTGIEMSAVDAVTKAAPRIAEAAVLAAAPETVADHMILTILKPVDIASVEQFCADPAMWQGQTSPGILYCSTALVRLYVPFTGSVEEFVAALQKTRFAGLPLRVTQIVERKVTVERVTD